LWTIKASVLHIKDIYNMNLFSPNSLTHVEQANTNIFLEEVTEHQPDGMRLDVDLTHQFRHDQIYRVFTLIRHSP